MAKRSSDEPATRSAKRTKINGVALPIEPVTSARQLQSLLTFQQDAPRQIRHGIRSFKAFLESILYAEDRTATASQQQILRSYLDSQSPKSSDSNDSPALPNLIQAWSFASQTNDDGLASTLAAVLALLLKTISSLINFRDLGLNICRTLLQRDQLKLVSQSVSAQRQKEHVISPCLRLLTELVTFDGGTFARKVFSDTVKSFTFDGKFLARNLSLWKYGAGDVQHNKRRVAVRSNAVRYLLAHFKHQGNAEKVDILKYGNVIRALFEHIQHDPVDVLKEIFDIVKVHVLDQQESFELRKEKGALLTERNLASIADLYKSNSPSSSLGPSANPAHDFLLYVCTDPAAGILQPNAGWYPPGTGMYRGASTDDIAEIDLGLDSVEWYQRVRSRLPIRNHVLAGLAQTLRPTNSNVESELFLAICRAAPELVADYFHKKAGYSFEPKLTATWIGYSALLYSVVNLPLPDLTTKLSGYQSIPPPLAICMDNLLPQPLTQKALTRCLNQQVELITFFAVRILAAAFQKLRSLLLTFRKAALAAGRLWEDGANEVVAAFSIRCPSFKDVAGVYRTSKAGSTLQEAVLRLLALYCEVTPGLAAEEKFDVSGPLSEALEQLGHSTEQGIGHDTSGQLRILSLNHMLRIAERSSDMHWFSKTKGQALSPIGMLARLLATLSKDQLRGAIWDLASTVLYENGVLQQETRRSALSALVASLRLFRNGEGLTNDAVFDFLDDCMSRLIRKPIKYEDDLDQLLEDVECPGPFSLLHLALLEQWPYAAKRDGSSYIARWLRHYVQASVTVAYEDKQAAARLSLKYNEASLDTRDESIAGDAPIKDVMQSMTHIAEGADTTQTPEMEKPDSFSTSKPESSIPVPLHLFKPPDEHPDALGLHRWSSKDVPSAISDGDLSALILCLSSQYPEVRPAALRNLRTILARVGPFTEPPPFDGASQVWVLIGTLINSVEGLIERPTSIDDEGENEEPPFPSIVTIYAALALRILLDPTHPLYTAANEFHLNNGPPKWNIEGVARYWIYTILYTHCIDTRGALDMRPKQSSSALNEEEFASTRSQQPYIDQQVSEADIGTPQRFLLSLIYLSLRTKHDLNIIRQHGVLEPLLSMASLPSAGSWIMEMLLMILWRITFIPGGSDMLITRKAVLAWLDMKLRSANRGAKKESKSEKPAFDTGPALGQLVCRIYETCDQQRFVKWAGAPLQGRLNRLAEVQTTAAQG